MNLKHLCKISTSGAIVRNFAANVLAASPIGNNKLIDEQQKLALKERCFLVDTDDKVIGTASKRDCHYVQADDVLPLHRAFSVFIFNNRGDLLLQRRSEHKVTYPDHYTNTCCSHPIADVPGEEDETDAIGIKLAAQRRLNYELGIPMDEIQPKDMLYLTRILYKDTGNGIWGEHEIDYILFVRKDVKVKPNPNEVSAICYVPRNELNAFIPTLEAPLTPWFQLILKHRLCLWWDNLNKIENFIDHKKILRFTSPTS